MGGIVPYVVLRIHYYNKCGKGFRGWGVGPYVVLCTHHSKFGNVGSGSRTLAPW